MKEHIITEIDIKPKARIEPTVGIQTETLALIARMTTKPSATRTSDINTLIYTLKEFGIWSRLDALWLLAGHDQTEAKLNILADQFNITEIGSPAWVEDQGFTASTGNLLDTSIILSTDVSEYSLNQASIGVYSRTASAAANSIEMGVFSTSPSGCFSSIAVFNTGSAISSIINNQTAIQSSISSSAGFATADRISSSKIALYKNGVQVTSSSSNASTALPAVASVTIGALHAWTGIFSYSAYSTRQISVAYIGNHLTAYQHAQFFNAIETYMTAIGSEVVGSFADTDRAIETVISDKQWVDVPITIKEQA